MAVLNDFHNDYKSLAKTESVFQKDLEAKTGISQKSISNAIMRPQFNKVFVAIIEALGYDIKVTYVKREKSVKEVLVDGTNKKG